MYACFAGHPKKKVAVIMRGPYFRGSRKAGFHCITKTSSNNIVYYFVSIGECNLTPTQLLGHKPLHERPGTETLLRKQAKEKKQGTNTRQQAVSTLRCTYSPGGNRCTEKVLPLTKHCIKRILFILD